MRSVIDPVLGVLRICLPPPPRSWLLVEVTEALLRATRLDGASATFVGVIGRALRAAAAAADERVVEGSRRMKADAAAVAALGLAVSFVRGCDRAMSANQETMRKRARTMGWGEEDKRWDGKLVWWPSTTTWSIQVLTKPERGETTTSNHRASHERRSLRHQPLSPDARDLTSTPSLRPFSSGWLPLGPSTKPPHLNGYPEHAQSLSHNPQESRTGKTLADAGTHTWTGARCLREPPNMMDGAVARRAGGELCYLCLYGVAWRSGQQLPDQRQVMHAYAGCVLSGRGKSIRIMVSVR